MKLAVYHSATMDLLGVLDSKEYPERSFGPMRNERTFELPARERAPARVFDHDETLHTFLKIAFTPLLLRNKKWETFIVFVDCNPKDLQRVRGFKPV